MPALLVAGGLLAWLRSTAYCKPFPIYGEADADHVFAPGILDDGLDIAAGPAPRPMSTPLDAGFIDLLRSEDETNIVEAAEGPTSSELVGDLDTRGWRSEPTPSRAGLGGGGGRGRRALGQPPSRVSGQRRAPLPYGRLGCIHCRVEAGDVAAVVVPERAASCWRGNHIDAVWTLEPVRPPMRQWSASSSVATSWTTGRPTMGATPTTRSSPAPGGPVIQLASMLPQTRCLLLTGPGDPTEYVKAIHYGELL